MKKSRKKLYSPRSKESYRLSRTRLENFVKCPRCFYLQERLGIKKPSMPGFSLNIAVDELLKKEFDIRRARGVAHPLMKEYGIKAVPFKHKDIDEWRDSLHRGIRYLHSKTNFLITGGVDDVWINDKKELIIVDYKATSTKYVINLDSKEKKHYKAYKRQMDIYQWLFRKNGFKVSDTGYFVFCNGRKDKKAFDGKLEFDVEIIPYQGNDSWVEEAILKAKKCLNKRKLPKSSDDCEYCNYRGKARKVEK